MGVGDIDVAIRQHVAEREDGDDGGNVFLEFDASRRGHTILAQRRLRFTAVVLGRHAGAALRRHCRAARILQRFAREAHERPNDRNRQRYRGGN